VGTFVFTLLILLRAAPCLFGADTAVPQVAALTLEESLAIALENNTDLVIAATALGQANRAAKAAWNDFLPQVSASAGIGHTHTLLSATPPNNDGFSWNGGVGATLTLTTAIPARAKQPVLAAQKAQADYDNKELTLKADVAKAFYRLISDKANVDILRANQTLTQQQYEQLRRNYNSGLA
jgi:outer membrane protein TolC